jgi:hypothetical protein
VSSASAPRPRTRRTNPSPAPPATTISTPVQRARGVVAQMVEELFPRQFDAPRRRRRVACTPRSATNRPLRSKRRSETLPPRTLCS